MHSPSQYYPSSSSNASETDSSPSLPKRRTVENSVILSRKYPRAPSQPPVGGNYNQNRRPVRAFDDSLVERGYNQPQSTFASPSANLRAQSPPHNTFVASRPSNQIQVRAQTPPPNNFVASRPSNQLQVRASSPSLNTSNQQNPPSNTFLSSRPSNQTRAYSPLPNSFASPRPSNQLQSRAQSPPPNTFASSRPSNQLQTRAYSPPPNNFASSRPSNQLQGRAQSPPSNTFGSSNQTRAYSPPPNSFVSARPSNQFQSRAQSPPPNTFTSSRPSNQNRAYSPPPNSFASSRPSNQFQSRAQSPPPNTSNQFLNNSYSTTGPVIPPRAPNEGYLREQYSPKPLKKILRKPWGKSKSVDTPYLFPYTPPPPKVTKDTNTFYLFNKLSNLRSKSPSPRPQDINKKVQFLDLPLHPSTLATQPRSRSPIRAVANFFKKPQTTTPKERPRSNSLSRFVKNLGHKVHPTPTLDGYTSDSSLTPYHKLIKDDLDVGYVSDSNTRKLSVPVTTTTSSIKNTFRKFSQGTVNFAKSLKISNERLADNLNDYEWTKQNLLKSSEFLNKSTERYSSYYSSGRGSKVGLQDTGVTKRNERVKVSKIK